MLWLAGKKHDLKDFPVGAPPEEQWCTQSMGRVLYTLHEKLGEIIVFPSLLLSEQYIMNLFSEYANELPPFKDYIQLIFNNRRMMVKNRNTGTRVAHLAMKKGSCSTPRRRLTSRALTTCLTYFLWLCHK